MSRIAKQQYHNTHPPSNSSPHHVQLGRALAGTLTMLNSSAATFRLRSVPAVASVVNAAAPLVLPTLAVVELAAGALVAPAALVLVVLVLVVLVLVVLVLVVLVLVVLVVVVLVVVVLVVVVLVVVLVLVLVVGIGTPRHAKHDSLRSHQRSRSYVQSVSLVRRDVKSGEPAPFSLQCDLTLICRYVGRSLIASQKQRTPNQPATTTIKSSSIVETRKKKKRMLATT